MDFNPLHLSDCVSFSPGHPSCGYFPLPKQSSFMFTALSLVILIPCVRDNMLFDILDFTFHHLT